RRRTSAAPLRSARWASDGREGRAEAAGRARTCRRASASAGRAWGPWASRFSGQVRAGGSEAKENLLARGAGGGTASTGAVLASHKEEAQGGGDPNLGRHALPGCPLQLESSTHSEGRVRPVIRRAFRRGLTVG